MTAQLNPIDLVAPGFRGLNTQQQDTLLNPAYCVQAYNTYIDASGRLSSRAGWSTATTTPITATPDVQVIHEYVKADGTVTPIVTWDGGIANAIADPEGSDISGAVTDADGTWWFQNHLDKCIGFQDGQKPIVYPGSGSFATVVESSGTAPTSHGGIGLCAFGRVWAVDSDGVTIKYTGLLDETDWGSAGSGSLSVNNIWTDGQDTITALAAFNGSLVIFGHNHILFYTDGQGSAIGLDPTQWYLADSIAGTGCETQWSLQYIGDTDLWFLSKNGLQSLGRLVQEKSNPVRNISKMVIGELLGDYRTQRNVSLDNVRSVYDQDKGFYLLTFPAASKTWVFNTDRMYRDDVGDMLAIVTRWGLAPTAWCKERDGDLLLGHAGGVGTYGSISGDNGTAFSFSYISPWLDLGEDFANRIKIMKRLGGILYAEGSTTLIYKWGFDFSPSFKSLTTTLEADSSAEWAVGEWGESEFGGVLSLRIIKHPARGSGQYIRVGLEADVNGPLALQQMEMYVKIGRLA